MYKIFFFLVVSVTFASCVESQKHEVNLNVYSEYIANNFSKYENVYNDVNDTLNYWVNERYKSAISLMFRDYWQVDSMLVFNDDSTRFFTIVNLPGQDYTKSEYVEEILGAFIDGEWQYYFGSGRGIMRHLYQTDEYKPFSMEQLRYVGRTRFISEFLNIGGSECSVDQDAMHVFFVKSYPQQKGDMAAIDSVILSQIQFRRTRKLSQKEYDEIVADLSSKEKPKEDFGDSKSSEVKLFDSEAWKNRYKR